MQEGALNITPCMRVCVRSHVLTGHAWKLSVPEALPPMQSKWFLGFFGGGDRKSPISGRFPAKPGPGWAWDRPRPGHRSICTDFQPGRLILRPFREVFEPHCDCIGVTLCYAMVLPGRKSGSRAGCRQDSSRESLKFELPAGRGPAGGPILRFAQ